MKILFYAPAAAGGHAEYTFELLRGLRESSPENWELHHATRRGLPAEFKDSGWQTHEIFPPLPSRLRFRSGAAWAANRIAYNFREVSALRRHLMREAWDVVHFQEVSPLFHRRLLARRRGATRFVYTVHNLQPHQRRVPQLAVWQDRVTAEAWSRFDALVFHSHGLQVGARRSLGSFGGRLAVIPHGIWSVPEPTAATSAVRRPARLLFLGVLRPNKGLHLLLDAVAQLPEVELTVAGAITHRAYFEGEIAPRLDRLRAAGARITTELAFVEKARMIAYLQQSDYLVLPYTDFESQSGMLMYAMACGVPVIASDAGALGETVRRHRVGRTYAGAGVEGLVAALATASSAESMALRDNVRRYAREHAWPRVAAQHGALYRELLPPARRPQPAGFADLSASTR